MIINRHKKTRYVKRNPHIIEAIQFNGDNLQDILEFANGKVGYNIFIPNGDEALPQLKLWLKGNGLSIDKEIKEDDYLIRDKSSPYGEYTVCGKKAFEELYVPEENLDCVDEMIERAKFANEAINKSDDT